MFIKEYYYTAPNGRKRIMWEYKCDGCGIIGTSDKYNLYKTKIHHCRNCNNKIEGKKKQGKPSPKRGKRYNHLRRENSPKWNGGRYIDYHGYVMILVDDGPRQKDGWKRYKKEHVVVMEKLLGRKLKKGESIHHIDVNRANNAPNNLFLYTNEQDHKNIHKSLEKIGIDLLKLGLVKFDPKTKEYKMLFDPLKIYGK